MTHHFQLALGDPADAVGSEVGVSCLDTTQAAQILIALLLPLGDQVLVCVALFYTVVIQLWGQTHTESQYLFIRDTSNEWISCGSIVVK